jgi:RimJ/RimL family protein N-acetyltransferase
MRWETPRLVATTVDADDIDALLTVRLSNPDRLLHTEGSAGQPGRYDRGMLERDLSIADADPAREALTVRRIDDGTVIGLIDVLREHSEDHLPWLGMVELHADDQRQGFGRELVEAAANWARDDVGAAALRAAVDADDDVGLAFVKACRFVPVDDRTRARADGNVDLIVLARPL